MDQSITLLQEIVRAARDGAEGISLVMDKTGDNALRQALGEEKKQYSAVEQDAGSHLIDLGGQAEPESAMNRAGMWMGMQLNTLMDKSPSHLAEILIQGNTMGVVGLLRAKRENPRADQPSLDLCSRMLTLQYDGIERAKSFL